MLKKEGTSAKEEKYPAPRRTPSTVLRKDCASGERCTAEREENRSLGRSTLENPTKEKPATQKNCIGFVEGIKSKGEKTNAARRRIRKQHLGRGES